MENKPHSLFLNVLNDIRNKAKNKKELKQYTQEEITQQTQETINQARKFICKYFEASPKQLESVLKNLRWSVAMQLVETEKIMNACNNCYDENMCPLSNRQRNGYMIPRLSMSPITGEMFLDLAYKPRTETCKAMPYTSEFLTMYKASGLPITFLERTFENYQRNLKAQDIITAKAQALLALRDKSSLILAGKAGSGKTHLATAIAIERMKAGDQAVFKLVSELLDEIRRANISSDDSYSSLMEKYKMVDCLVLDDLGKERGTRAGFDYLYQIIDARYRNKLQTIVTTNATSIEELELNTNSEYIKPMISRLLEFGAWCCIQNAPDYRILKSRQDNTHESQ